MALGRLDPRIGDAIIRAADEILAGALRDQFVVDVYQAGAGTSHNMNANEVLANRAGEMLGGASAASTPVHPNDHVNMGSPPTTCSPRPRGWPLLLGARARRRRPRAGGVVARKGREFDGVLKVGRTHLQDAVPMTLGQEFGGYAACLERGADDVDRAASNCTS